MKRIKLGLLAGLVMQMAMVALNAQITISVTPDPYQSQNYYCVGQSLTCSVQASSNPAQPTQPACCNGSNTGSWTLDKYEYTWQYNGSNNFAIHESASPSDTANYTVPSGTFSLTCNIGYKWKCSDGSTVGYTSPSDTSSPYNSTAATFPDDSSGANPTIPAPNNAPNISMPDNFITRIQVGVVAGWFTDTYYYLKGGKFTGVTDSDSYTDSGSGNHTDCGATGVTVSWTSASPNLSYGFGGSAYNVSYSASLGVNLASTGSSSPPIGADHKRVFYEIYNRNSQITAATNSGSSLYYNDGFGDQLLGPATPNATLPSTSTVTGHTLATANQNCCPDTNQD